MRNFLKIALLVLTIAITTTTYSQPLPGGNPEDSGDTPVGGMASIDGELLVLMLMGATYGAITLYRKKQNINCAGKEPD